MKLIAICGNKGHGKDTLADILANNHGYIKIAFGDVLKQAVIIMTEFSDKDFTQENKEIRSDKGSPRDYMIRVASAVRSINKYAFTEAIERRIMLEKSFNPNVKIIVSDLRFDEELEMIEQYGGYMIHIQRNKLYSKKLKKFLMNFVAPTIYCSKNLKLARFILRAFFFFNREERKLYGHHSEMNGLIYRFISPISIINDGTINDMEKVVAQFMNETSIF